jgi:hypothetical protein
MSMDEVRYCKIHTSGSIGVNRIATKLHLGDRTALRFLLAKEQAWSSASRSVLTADTGSLGDRPRAFQEEGRKNRRTIRVATRLATIN